MLRCTAVVFAICSLAFSAAADSGVAALAAPGDCAQPSADYETPPLYEQPAGVSGSAAEHFAPRVDSDVLGLLPIDLTRTRVGATLVGTASETVGLVGGAAGATVDGVSGAVGGAADGVGSGLAGAVGGAGNAIGAEGLGAVAGSATDALGSGGLTGSALGTATGAVDALTNTATGATTGVLGGPK